MERLPSSFPGGLGQADLSFFPQLPAGPAPQLLLEWHLSKQGCSGCEASWLVLARMWRMSWYHHHLFPLVRGTSTFCVEKLVPQTLVYPPLSSRTITFSNLSSKTGGKTKAVTSSFKQKLRDILYDFPWQSRHTFMFFMTQNCSLLCLEARLSSSLP